MRVALVIIVSFLVVDMQAQQIPPFKLLRQEEDYSFLRNDSSASGYHRMKFIPLSANRQIYISLGGEVRFQYFYAKNENWGDGSQDKDGYILNRLLVHADLRLDNHLRLFTQLQSSTAGSRVDANPVEENPLDVHQAFAEWQGRSGNTIISISAGRQEFLYGSQRIVSVRDGPNSRQSFDALRFRIKHNRHSTDIFYSQFVPSQKGIFDDAWNSDTRFWGAYQTFSSRINKGQLELYYLAIKKRKAQFNDGAGEERRHSLGSRISGMYNRWSYDMEALYQFGKFNTKNISAWTASLNMSYKFKEAKLKPEVGLKSEIISGDKQKGDRGLQTFNPLFPRGAYFGLAALIGPGNLVDLHPSLALTILKPLALEIDYAIFWRHRTGDGLYAVSTVPVYGDANSTAKHIGRQLAMNWIWRPGHFFYFRYELTWFDTGAYLKQAGTGKDIIFTGLTAQLKF